MFEDKGYRVFLESVLEENPSTCVTNVVYGRSSDARRYVEMAESAGLSVVAVGRREDFSEALKSISGPLIVLILRDKIGSLVKRMLTAACERTDATYILGIHSGVHLDPDTNAISVITAYSHKIVSDTPASLRVSEASERALRINALRLEIAKAQDEQPLTETTHLPM